MSAASIIISALPVYARDYLIGSQDVVKITVFDNPDLTTEARVSGEGKITFLFWAK
jgi:polysaccharide export outer membrane protein